MKINATYAANNAVNTAPIRMFVRPDSRFVFNNNKLMAINTIDSGSNPRMTVLPVTKLMINTDMDDEIGLLLNSALEDDLRSNSDLEGEIDILQDEIENRPGRN